MKNVLFIPYFLESHLLPTLGIARALQHRYNIIYALPEKLKWFPELHGYEYINLESVPFGIGFEKTIRKSEGSKSPHHDALIDRRNSRIAKHREKKLKAVIDSVQPVFIFLDMLSSTDFILLYPYLHSHKAGVAIHNPMLSTYSTPGYPAVGSSLTPLNSIKTKLESKMIKALNTIYNIKEAIVWRGHSNKEMIRSEFRKNKIPDKFRIRSDNHFAVFFENIPEVITSPIELEFTGRPLLENQYYVGPLQVIDRNEKSGTADWQELLQLVQSWKKEKNTKIIVCSFGSMSDTGYVHIVSFLEKIIEIASVRNDLKFICAFPDKKGMIDKKIIPSNVYLYRRIPQIKLLPYCDLFITHAGLGSVKEGISFAVPMLAYPFTTKWDSNGNATKIAYHKIGLRGNIRKDSAKAIEKKIDSILNDSSYSENLMTLKKNIEQKYTEEVFLKLFEKIMSDIRERFRRE